MSTTRWMERKGIYRNIDVKKDKTENHQTHPIVEVAAIITSLPLSLYLALSLPPSHQVALSLYASLLFSISPSLSLLVSP